MTTENQQHQEKIFIGSVNGDATKEQLREFLSQFGAVKSFQWKLRNVFNRVKAGEGAEADQEKERTKIAHCVVGFESYKQQGGAEAVIAALEGKEFPGISRVGEPLRAKLYEAREKPEATEKPKRVRQPKSDAARVDQEAAPKEPRQQKPRKEKDTSRTEPSKHKLFVSNLPFNVNPSKLREIFEEKGFSVSYASVVRDRLQSTRHEGTYLKSRGFGFVELGVRRPQADIERDEAQLKLEQMNIADADPEAKKPRVKTHKLRNELTDQEVAQVEKEVQRCAQEMNQYEYNGRQLNVAISMERPVKVGETQQ